MNSLLRDLDDLIKQFHDEGTFESQYLSAAKMLRAVVDRHRESHDSQSEMSSEHRDQYGVKR